MRILVRAVFQVEYNPTGRLVSTGRFDKDGRAILQSDRVIVKPGEEFVLEDEATIRCLLTLGCIEVISSEYKYLEEEMAEAAWVERNGPRPVEPAAEVWPKPLYANQKTVGGGELSPVGDFSDLL